jgi:hypothetical protein
MCPSVSRPHRSRPPNIHRVAALGVKAGAGVSGALWKGSRSSWTACASDDVRDLIAKTYVSRILTKLGDLDRTQLVILAYESGLVTTA